MIPIMLRSFGRSGSTLMMQVLGSHKNVAFDRVYPFENRHLTYIHRLSAVMKKERKFSEQWGPDTLFNSNALYVGATPYKNIEIFNENDLSRRSLEYLWKALSEEILEKSEDFDLSLPTYYAEKVVQDICHDINSVVEAKNLFVFRDPRDEFISIKSFNEKRGFNGFGWLESDTDESFALRMAESRKEYMRNLVNINNDHRRMVILYERFMESPHEHTKKIGDWIGLELSYDTVLDGLGSVSQHITGGNVSEPRWKKELPLSIKQIFGNILGEELLALGYEV